MPPGTGHEPADGGDPLRWHRAPVVGFPTWATDRPELGICTVKLDGLWQIAAIDLPGGSPRPLTRQPGGVSVAAIDPTGTWVWWFDDGDGGEWGSWRVQRFDSEPGDHRPQTPAAEGYQSGICLGPAGLAVLGTLDADGQHRIVRVRIDLDSGGVSEPPVELYAHDGAAAPERLSPDGLTAIIRHSETGDSEHPALRLIRTDDGQEVAAADDGASGSLRALDWQDDLVLLARRRGDDLMLATWDLRTSAIDDLPWALSGSIRDAHFLTPRGAPSGAAETNRRVVASVDTATGSKLVIGDLTTSDVSDVGPSEGTIHEVASRPDGDVWFRWSTSASPRRNLALSDTELPNVPDLGDRSARAVFATVPGAGGDVPYLLRVPDAAAPHPVLIDLHGGPFMRDSDQFDADAASWIDRGYAVLKVNYRGSVGYGAAWRDGILADVGYTELADVVAVVDALIADGTVDPARVILSGRSWGGYLTLMGIGIYPGRWAAAIAHVPVGDFTAAYEDVRGDIQTMDRYLFGGSPTEVPEVYRRASPVSYVSEVETPVLILASTNDPRCPYRQARIYIDAMEAAGREHEVYLFQAGHYSADDQEICRQSELSAEFAARHLTAP